MQANSPSAFFLSLTLHGLVVALIVFFSITVHNQVKEPPKVFELVAGAGDNYAATEAPALGDSDVVKFNVPARPTPVMRTPPPEPVVQPAPEEPPVVISPEPKPRPVEKRPVEKRPVSKPEVKPKPKAPEKLDIKPMTKEEFEKLYGKQRNPAATPPPAPKVRTINAAGIRSGVIGGSTNNKTGGAGGTALTRSEQSLVDSYMALLKQRLRAALLRPPGLSDLLHAQVHFRIGSDGTLSGVKIAKSSGSAAFDQAVLDAFARVRSIGPPPDGGDGAWDLTFYIVEEG